MRDTQAPIARKDGLVVQKMPDELLVYDTQADKAHCLNETASKVWEACDGKQSISEIAATLGTSPDPGTNTDLVLLAVDQLRERNLLENSEQLGDPLSSRRELIKKVGMASVIALPVVASLAAPKSALASASCACLTDTDCLATPGCPATCDVPAGTCV